MQQYGHERYKDLNEDEKQKLVGYGKKYYKTRKNALLYKKLLFQRNDLKSSFAEENKDGLKKQF